MKTKKKEEISIDRIRETLKYVSQFKNTNFVIAIDGRAIEEGDILSLGADITLLAGASIGIAVVLGLSDQTDFKRRRQSEHARLLSLAEQLCQSINRAGKLRGFVVQANEQDADTKSVGKKVMDILGKGPLPVFVTKAADGKVSWFDRLNETIMSVCNAKLIDKLLYLARVEGIYREDKSLLREATPSEARELVSRGIITGQFAKFVALAEEAIKANVTRVHLVSGKVNGGLLCELCTKDGVGTMIYGNRYQEIRTARAADICGILNLVNTFNKKRVEARRYTEEMIGQQLSYYRVAVKDDEVIACGCLRCFPDEDKALITSFTIEESSLTQGVGDFMLKHLLQEARDCGANLVTLTGLQTGHWWLSRDFTVGMPSDLPTEFQNSASSAGIILARRLEQ